MILFCSDYKSRATTTPCYFYKKALYSYEYRHELTRSHCNIGLENDL